MPAARRCLVLVAAVTVADLAALAPQLSAANAQSGRDTTVKRAGAPKHANGGTMVKELTIGDANGADEYLFSSIANVLIAKDGTIWILDVPEQTSNPASLRVFDAKGKHVRNVGQRGAGPGEYQQPTGLAQLPDGRVLLRDITSGRINVYTPDGKPVTTWTFTTQFSYPIRGGAGLVVDATGMIWMPFMITDPVDRTKRTFAYARLNSAGAIIDTIMAPELPSPPRASITITSNEGRSRATFGAPYQPGAFSVWHPGGYFATAISSHYAIDLRLPPASKTRWSEGDPVVSIRRDLPAVTIVEAERDNRRAILEAQVDGRKGDRSGSIPEIPRVKPPIRSAQFASDGRIWVSVSVPSERVQPEPVEPRPGSIPLPPLQWREPVAMDVFEPTGVYLGRVALPAGTFPMVIKGDEVWAGSRDADGVMYLHKYRVTWK